MRRILSAISLASVLALATPALAGGNSNKFESTLNAPLGGAVNVEVIIGEDLAYRADHLPKDFRDRRDIRHNAGFTNNGFYGERDLNRLAERLERKTMERLAKYGVDVDENAATTLTLVLTDARPNRPTFEQMSREPGLSMRSFGNGGAEFEGSLERGDEVLGTFSYAWFDNDIHDAQYGSTWSDANRAIDKFAKKTAKSLQSPADS